MEETRNACRILQGKLEDQKEEGRIIYRFVVRICKM